MCGQDWRERYTGEAFFTQKQALAIVFRVFVCLGDEVSEKWQLCPSMNRMEENFILSTAVISSYLKPKDCMPPGEL